MTTRRPWTPTERRLLRELYPHVPTADIAALLERSVGSVYGQAVDTMGLHKTPAYMAGVTSGRIQRARSLPSMVATQFRPGLVPWNKGLKGWRAPGCERGWFAPGRRPHTWVPVGSYRINADGILDRKVSDTGYPPRDWQGVHRLVWIAAHGPIPSGHIVRFLPGRRSTVLEQITLDAIECISRAEHAQRNHPRSKSPELAKLYQLKGAITRQVNRLARNQEQEQQQRKAA